MPSSTPNLNSNYNPNHFFKKIIGYCTYYVLHLSITLNHDLCCNYLDPTKLPYDPPEKLQ